MAKGEDESEQPAAEMTKSRWGTFAAKLRTVVFGIARSIRFREGRQVRNGPIRPHASECRVNWGVDVAHLVTQCEHSCDVHAQWPVVPFRLTRR